MATPAFPTIAAIADVLGLSLDAVWAEINQPVGGAGSVPSASTHVSRLTSQVPAARWTRRGYRTNRCQA